MFLRFISFFFVLHVIKLNYGNLMDNPIDEVALLAFFNI